MAFPQSPDPGHISALVAIIASGVSGGAQGATDGRGLASLVGADYKPGRKRLVLDLNTLGLAKLDNIEGIAWGPKLPNGNDTLVLVSDNNFNTASQITQLLAFEVQPKK